MTKSTYPTTADSALLVMDFQVLLLENYLEKEAAINVLQATASLINSARKAEVPVIFVTVGFRTDYPEVSPNNALFSSIRNAGAFGLGHADTAIHSAVFPLPQETIIVKHRIGAFTATPLDMILRSKGITSLTLAGVTTSGVVLSTTTQAFDLDYHVQIARECCADPDAEINRTLLETIFPQTVAVKKVADIQASWN